MADITGTRGDTNRYDVAVTRSGAAVDITGAELWFTAKVRLSDADDAATSIQKTYSGGGITYPNAASGQARITILPADTASLTKDTVYYYDVQMKEADGTITTIISGKWTVKMDTTQRDVVTI